MKAGIFTTTVNNITSFGDDVRQFRLAFDPEVTFEFDPGQFLNVIFPAKADEKPLKRPYSIASPPSWKGFVDLCVKRVPDGKATENFWGLNEGDKLDIQGPLGRFTLKEPQAQTIVFVSTGTGIAPFRAMFHELLSQGSQTEMLNIFGNRYEDGIPYQEEFEKLAADHPNFQNVFTVSRPKNWQGETEYVQHLISKYIKEPSSTQMYLCGLNNMIQATRDVALELGMSSDQIFYEKYD